jgi:hypothetical protein
MSGLEVDGIPGQQVRAYQIVIMALLIGILTFAGIALILWDQGQVPLAPGVWPLAYVALGFGGMILLARLVFLPAVTAAARKRLRADPDVTTAKLFGLFGSRMITGAALLEGGAFMFLITFLMLGAPWALAGGLGFGVLMAVLHFPTRERVEQWIARQREVLEQERLRM